MRRQPIIEFLRDFGATVFWQGLSKLFQIVGIGHALRCLGPEAAGISGSVLILAGAVYILLELGLDIVAVRHVVAKTQTLDKIARALFTLRILLSFGGGIVWVVGGWLFLAPGEFRLVWTLGGLYIATTCVGYLWYFQATHQVKRLSYVQAGIGVGMSYLFVALFKPGVPAGSDIVVMILVNGVVNAAVWWDIQRRLGIDLFRWDSMPLALRLFREGLPTWVFNLSYYGLSNLGVPLCYWLLSRDDAGQFRASAYVVASMQLFLSYLSYMLNPRIVAWRRDRPERFLIRCGGVVAVIIGIGTLVFGFAWWLRRPLTLILFGEEYLPTAVVLPPLVLSKFVAVASGVLAWALFADHRDWWAVLCCGFGFLGSLGIHLWLLPVWGLAGSGWLTLAGEGILLCGCVLAVSRIKGGGAPATSRTEDS